ncbi:hypothetical protein ACFV0Z_12755 [Streptomyces xiamenensis]|uniref:hypothetical protein n=1 Tax=Streptomyces xiamenensis TaxID=408015 RepID=UPI0036CEBCCF
MLNTTSSLAAEPTAVMPATSPGVMDGEVLGSLGAGGAALALTVVLVLGMKAAGKGRQLPWIAVLILSMVAATCYAAAGGLWSLPADLLGSLLGAIGVGGGDGPLGNVGMGAICICVAAWIYWKQMSLKQLAIAGFVMAYVAGRAGGIWGVGADVIEQAAATLGV